MLKYVIATLAVFAAANSFAATADAAAGKGHPKKGHEAGKDHEAGNDHAKKGHEAGKDKSAPVAGEKPVK